jgi:AcrR family transcriptional regulator
LQAPEIERMSHDDAKERIIAAAGPLFAEVGYDGTTVRQICKSAEVNFASVNYHFGDKRRLYVETVKAAHRESTGQVALPDDLAWPTPEEALRQMIAVIARHLLRPDTKPWQIRLIMKEVIQPTEVGRELVDQAFRPFFERLMRIVGELGPAATPPHRLQFMVFSIVGQCVYHRIARDVIAQLTSPEHVRRHFTPDQLADHIYQFSLAGIRCAASADHPLDETRHGGAERANLAISAEGKRKNTERQTTSTD